jgi:O-acetyl-ADP-ribose deacetylase (regulator of RNase III)
MANIEVMRGDITTLRVDAIVNAANESLMGGGGVDGAIHRAAGPRLPAACAAVAPCPTGEARLTPGFDLPAKFIIHTVGPVWRGGEAGEDALLASCYRNSLALGARQGVATIAFPAISTGAFGFPLKRAASIAASETGRFLASQPGSLRTVYFVCFGGDRAYEAYAGQVRRLSQRRHG